MSLEDDIKGECRLYAIEWAISQLFASTFAQTGEGAEAMFDEFRKTALESARKSTYPRLGAAMSDLASAEKEAAIDRLLGFVKDALANIQAGRS
jgi:hypothetical protein